MNVKKDKKQQQTQTNLEHWLQKHRQQYYKKVFNDIQFRLLLSLKYDVFIMLY